MLRRSLVIALIGLCAVLAACSSTPSSSAARGPNPCGKVTQIPKRAAHVVWVVMENHTYDDVLGGHSAPYLSRLARQCASARRFIAETHPSLPNYIAMTSGATQGVTDDAGPSSHHLTAPSLFGLLGDHGWRALQERMPEPCAPDNSGRYAVRHNPAVYYADASAACRARDVALGRRPDVSAPFTFVTPDLCHDMHDCDVATGDRWLSGFLPKVFASRQYRAGHAVVVLTFDEGVGSDNRIPTLVMAPWVRPGTASTVRFDHYALLRATQELLGARPLLGGAARAARMRAALRF